MTARFAEHGITTGIFLGATCRIPAIICGKCSRDATFCENLIRFKTFVSRDDVNRRTAQMQGGVCMDSIVLRGNGHVTRVHEDFVFCMQSIIIGSHIDITTVHIDELFSHQALACRSHLNR